MTYLAFLVFAVAIWFVAAWVFAWLCGIILRFVLRPLDVPFDIELRRERRVTRIAFMSQLFWYGGPVLLVVTYIVGAVRHFRMMSAAERNHAPVKHPIIPRFTISDLLVMVFSLGFFPVISAQLTPNMGDIQSAQVLILILGAISFPAYFICALYRLETNEVPAGWVRSAFLFIAPYVFHACAACVTAPFYLLVLSSSRSGIIPELYFGFYGGVLLAGRLIAARAGALARPTGSVAVLSAAKPSISPANESAAGTSEAAANAVQK